MGQSTDFSSDFSSSFASSFAGLGGGESIPQPSANIALPADGTVPDGWTYTGNGGNSVYRDTSGELIVATNNTPRPDHTVDGDYIGWLKGPATTNVCTNNNNNISATTNMSVTGGVTLSTLNDFASVVAGKLSTANGGTTVYQASTSGTAGTVIINGAIGATGSCSAQVYARRVSGGNGSFGITPDASAVEISDSTYQLLKAENLTATNVADTFVMTLPAFCNIRFTLNQLETGPRGSPVILVNGASASSAVDRLTVNPVSGYAPFNNDAGAYFVQLTPANDINPDLAFALTAQNGSSTASNTYAMQAPSGRSKFAPIVRVGSTSEIAGDSQGYKKGQKTWVGMTWAENTFFGLAGPSVYNVSESTITTVVSGIDRLYAGSTDFVGHFPCHMHGILIFDEVLTVPQAGTYMVEAGNQLIPWSGQSLATGPFSNQVGADNDGEKAGIDVFNSFFPNNLNWLVSGGTPATTVLFYSGTSGVDDWWLNADTGEIGVPFQRYIDIVRGCRNGTFLVGVDVSGQSDAGNSTKEEYKAGQLQKFAIMRQYIGNIDIGLINIATNTSGNFAGYQTVREATRELASENSDLFLLPEIYDLALVDTIHPTAESNITLTQRVVRKCAEVLGETVSGSVDGPSAGTAVRTGTQIDVPIIHDGGTDFTPTTGIEGFVYDDDGSLITFTSAVRLNATTVRLTLSSSPTGGAGTGTLYYAYNSMNTINKANILVDNSAQALPLISFTQTGL